MAMQSDVHPAETCDSSAHRPRRVNFANQPPGPRPCSIAAALSTIGEKWSLLVVRELTYGVSRFEQIVSYTGASRDMIALRLRRLEDAGVVERKAYQQAPVRYDYGLTDAGRDLYPVLLSLMEWGDKHAVEEPSLRLVHACGANLDIAHVCADCGGDLTPELITLTARGGSSNEREW